jgi:hypothetical protein
MSEPNSLDLMYEALTGPSRSIYKENPGLVLAAAVKAAGGVIRISSDDVLMAPPNTTMFLEPMTDDIIIVVSHDECTNCGNDILPDQVRVKCCPEHTPERGPKIVCVECAEKLHPKEEANGELVSTSE